MFNLSKKETILSSNFGSIVIGVEYALCRLTCNSRNFASISAGLAVVRASRRAESNDRYRAVGLRRLERRRSFFAELRFSYSILHALICALVECFVSFRRRRRRFDGLVAFSLRVLVPAAPEAREHVEPQAKFLY